MVAGHVPHGGRLLFHARVPAGHRLPRGRFPLASRHALHRPPHPVRRAADLQPRRGSQPARLGQHHDARGAAAAVERQGLRPVPARLRRHGLRHHHHAVGRRRHRARRRQPVRAPGVQPPGRADAPAAGRAERGLPEGLQGSDRSRRLDRRRLPGPERDRDRRRARGGRHASFCLRRLAQRPLQPARQSPDDARAGVVALPETGARTLGLRNRRRRDAAGQGRSGRRSLSIRRAGSATPRSCCAPRR